MLCKAVKLIVSLQRQQNLGDTLRTKFDRYADPVVLAVFPAVAGHPEKRSDERPALAFS